MMHRGVPLTILCGLGLMAACGESMPVDATAQKAEDAASEKARIVEDAATLKAQDVREKAEDEAKEMENAEKTGG